MPHGVCRLSGVTAESVFNGKFEEMQFHNTEEPPGMPVSMGKGQVKEMCLQMFLEGSN